MFSNNFSLLSKQYSKRTHPSMHFSITFHMVCSNEMLVKYKAE